MPTPADALCEAPSDTPVPTPTPTLAPVATPQPVPTPLPTSTPAPISPPAFVDPLVGLAPLIDSGNIISVWHFNPATQNEPPLYGWGLFDPRPVFARVNTITRMVSGQFYLINVKQAQTVTLNSTERVLFPGWNPVSW